MKQEYEKNSITLLSDTTMGTGAGVAIKSARFTLVKGDLNSIFRARRSVMATMRNIKPSRLSTTPPACQWRRASFTRSSDYSIFRCSRWR